MRCTVNTPGSDFASFVITRSYGRGDPGAGAARCSACGAAGACSAGGAGGGSCAEDGEEKATSAHGAIAMMAKRKRRVMVASFWRRIMARRNGRYSTLLRMKHFR